MDRPLVRPTVLRDVGPRGHRRPRSGACVLLLTVLVACQPQGSTAPEPTQGVPTVLDGDSLRVTTTDGELEVRLDGINAPESSECLGDLARIRLQELAEPSVQIEATGTDQFGRTLAVVRNDSTLLNQVMVAEGLAIATSGGPLSDDLVSFEDAARTAGLGIWDPSACGPSIDAHVEIEFRRPNPPGADDPDEEQVSLRNLGAVAVDLSGFVLRDESSANRLRLPSGTILEAGATIRVWTGCAANEGVTWCSDTPIWNNGGDSALLLSPDGNVVAHARYDPDR